MSGAIRPGGLAGFYWGMIQDSVAAGKPSRTTIREITAALTNEGITPPTTFAAEVGNLIVSARQMLNAGYTLQAAAPQSAITSDLVSVPFYARDLNTRNAQPTYQVRYQEFVQTVEGTIAQYKTVTYTQRLPLTVGDLLNDILEAAGSSASAYNQSVTDVQLVSIASI